MVWKSWDQPGYEQLCRKGAVNLGRHDLDMSQQHALAAGSNLQLSTSESEVKVRTESSHCLCSYHVVGVNRGTHGRKHYWSYSK